MLIGGLSYAMQLPGPGSNLCCAIKLDCHHLHSAIPTNQADPARASPLTTDSISKHACVAFRVHGACLDNF